MLLTGLIAAPVHAMPFNLKFNYLLLLITFESFIICVIRPNDFYKVEIRAT